MKQKEYPMDEDYYRALKFLTERIAERDEIAEQYKLLPPEKRLKALRTLDELDKNLEEHEQALAKEYEITQELRRSQEKRDEMYEDLYERMKGIFIHVKYRHPEDFEKFRASMVKGYTPEDEQEFYDEIAILEAGDLISIIARKGETREQTEEFLKNYRAAEKEKQ